MFSNESHIEGIFTYREINKISGDVEYEYIDNNVITQQGINTLFLRAVLDDMNGDMELSHFALGIDDGDQESPGQGWGVLNPKPAEKFYTSTNQFVVHEVERSDMTIDYPDANTLQAGTLLDGRYVLDTFYPNDVDLRYTSATFRFVNGTSFSYKRFPVRSLSRLIDVQIIWSFRFTNSYTYICPTPDRDSLRYTYTLAEDQTLSRFDDNLHIETISTPSLVDVYVADDGDVIYISTGRRYTRLDENLDMIRDRLIATASDIVKFACDRNKNSYAVLDSPDSNIVKLNQDGTVVWSISLDTNTSVRDIQVLDDNRIGVSIEDSTYGMSSNNKVYIINALSGSVMYQSTYNDGLGSTGKLSVFSTSGGELFVLQRGINASARNNIIKVAFDLSELDRIQLTSYPSSFIAVHGNNFIISTENNRTEKFDADLVSIWNINRSYELLSTDRDEFIYGSNGTIIDRMTPNGDLDTANTNPSPISRMSSVGEKWSFFS